MFYADFATLFCAEGCWILGVYVWESAFQGPLGSNSRPHHISRVVVRHHDTLATFYDANLLSMNDPDDSTAFGVKNDKNGDFFDNDCFWSGSITWY